MVSRMSNANVSVSASARAVNRQPCTGLGRWANQWGVQGVVVHSDARRGVQDVPDLVVPHQIDRLAVFVPKLCRTGGCDQKFTLRSPLECVFGSDLAALAESDVSCS